MSYHLTPNLVRGCARHLAKKHGAKIADKGDAPLMKLIAFALDLMGIQDKKGFLRRYATTIGETIYLPFELGDTGEGALALPVQLEVFWHEMHHVRQFQKDPARYMPRYLSSSAKRAWYEARALHVSMEALWFLTGKLAHPTVLAARLSAYGCTAGDIRTVEKQLRIVAGVVRQGKLHNQIAKDGVAYLRRRARRLGR